MKDKEARRALQTAVEHRLAALEGDPWLAAKIIHRAKGEQPYMKKRISVGLILTIVAVIAMATAAMATNVFGLFGYMDWNGVFHADDIQPDMSVSGNTPAPDMVRNMAQEELIDKILEEREAGELVMIYAGEGDEMRPLASANRRADVSSAEELHELLQAAPWLEAPMVIPEGYEFVSGEVIYDRYASASYASPVREVAAEGLTVERYALDEKQDFISGYYMLFRCCEEDYHYISVNASLCGNDGDEYAAGINPDQTAESIDVKGMDQAVYVASDKVHSMVMRRGLEQDIVYATSPDVADTEWVYEYLEISITAPQLIAEEMAMIIAEK